MKQLLSSKNSSGSKADMTTFRGPRAEPPIPTERICVKRPAGDDGGLICSNQKYQIQNYRLKTNMMKVILSSCN
ncbi:hypothetical protein Syun_007099 [Stephania yunnanensis]|uniref:Uncharacterized protein n=1 Tax=Stephania yunnanensis TaxID=152371 RepID=A0AAP0KZC8_9MAGN